jgi:N-acylethanolamine-hydrolysing acid amidase
MPSFKQLALLAAVTLACSGATTSPYYLGKNSQGLDIFKIDLSLLPEERFQGPALHYKDKILALLQEYEPYIPQVVVDAFSYLDWGIRWYHYDKYYEIAGMAKLANVNPSLALLANYVYEFESFCTSIITRLQNGTILHMRNLDFDFPDRMRDVTYIAKFYDGDTYLYEGVMFGGLVAMQTGSRPGHYSVTLNQRTPSDGSSVVDILENISLLLMSYNQACWSIRDTLYACSNFTCAVDRLTHETHIAPSYIIIAGTQANEGVVITRDRFGPANIRSLSDEQWYLVQTNFDHFDGDYRIRYTSARDRLEAIGSANITPERAYNEVLE